MPIRKAMIDFDDRLHADMMALANGNNRTLREEVEHACRRHLAAPPTVRVDTPELPPAEIVVSAKPKPKRGRPRKEK